ncbi:MAG: hypothetical protein ACTHLH_12195 [Solirubrobacterales bacterium]
MQDVVPVDIELFDYRVLKDGLFPFSTQVEPSREEAGGEKIEDRQPDPGPVERFEDRADRFQGGRRRQLDNGKPVVLDRLDVLFIGLTDLGAQGGALLGLQLEVVGDLFEPSMEAIASEDGSQRQNEERGLLFDGAVLRGRVLVPVEDSLFDIVVIEQGP